MRKKPPVIDGRIEYDNLMMHRERDPSLLFINSNPYCVIRLCLFDLPPRAIVRIETRFEFDPRPYQRSRYRRIRAFVVREQRNYTEQYRIESGGRMTIEVYRQAANARLEKPEHRITYRIDEDLRRPVREQHQRMTLRLEHELREPPYQFVKQPVTAPSVPGSLFSSL